ncbi:MAG: TonB-dependent receptor [Pseudomonadota bacterium]|nr:TonB-dependent receptor [Pseudomonadota bacterium]
MLLIRSEFILRASAAALAVGTAFPAFAQQPAAAPEQSATDGDQTQSAAREASDEGTITVTGWRLRELDQESSTASRLGLSIRDTPATIDQIDSGEILTRGFRTVEEATVSLPGVTSGGSPGDPSLFAMRGFIGEQITLLHNGLYLGPANMINRPGNTFNIASIEVLKGPASVLYGQGTIGGAVNVINKSPDFKADSLQFLGSYATYETVSTGVGGNKIFSDAVAGRLDASYHRTDGYVDRAPSNSFNTTAALLFKPSADLSVELSVDFLKDDLSPYWGTPLIPRAFATDPMDGVLSSDLELVVDERLRFENYNVADYRTKSWHVWPRLAIAWSPSEAVTVSNTAYWFHADRQWANAENYVFNSGTGLIDRDRFFVFHNQDLLGNQLSVAWKHSLAGLDNKFVVGVDYSHLDFIRTRGFPDGDSVDPVNPNPGLFGPMVKRVSPTRWDQGALFAEDVLSITSALKLVTGFRAERLWLTRENFNVDGSFNAGSSFKRTYKPLNWRAGLVYDIVRNVTAYMSYSTGKDPVGNNIFLVNANQDFGLSSSRQFEAGVKADLMGGRGSLTAAVYDIKRKNILTLVGTETLSNIGSQTSKGFEVSGQVKVTRNWTLIGSGAYVDAQYGSFVDPNYGIDASGNRPANVPKWVGNFWTTVRNVGGLPLEIGGGIKYVGSRQGNSANTLTLKSYATGIAYATVEVTPNISLTGRVNNMWNKKFVQWADIYYPSQVILGEPRRFEVGVLGRF